MIEVFDTAAAGQALACRMLPCPGCGQPLRPWGHARERLVRQPGGDLLRVRPDRALCTGCQGTYVVLDARLLPRRANTADLIGQALIGAALGSGHRAVAALLAVPHATVRGWVRRATASAGQLRVLGIQAVVRLDPDCFTTPVRPSGLAYALDALGGAAMALERRYKLPSASPWTRVTVITRGRLLSPSPAG